MYQAIKWEVRDHTGILTLNRPDRLNAIDTTMRNEIADVVRKAEYDNDVWTLIITGTGRGFCSGAEMVPWVRSPLRSKRKNPEVALSAVPAHSSAAPIASPVGR